MKLTTPAVRTALAAAALLAVAAAATIVPPTPAALAAPGDDAEKPKKPTIVYRFDEAGDYDAGPVVEAVARALGHPAVIDPRLVGRKALRVGAPGDFTLDALRALLDANDIRLVCVRGAAGTLTLRAVRRGDLHEVLVAPPRLLAPGEPIPETEELVELHVRPRHGRANDIFSILRGMIGRDPDRLGNILYVRGSETLILVDMASKVRAYAETIARLDAPRPTYRVLVEVWSGPRDTLAGLAERDAPAARARLRELAGRDDAGVRLLGATAEDIASGSSSWERTARIEAADGRLREVRNQLTISPDDERFALALRGSATTVRRGEGASGSDALTWSLDGHVAAVHGTERLFIDMSPDGDGPSLAILARVVELGEDR